MGVSAWASEEGASPTQKDTAGAQVVVLKLQLHQNHLESWLISMLLNPIPVFLT